MAAERISQLLNVSVAKEPFYLILVEKNLQRLRVLEFDYELRVVADYPCATGENLGIKEISGDSKTPEGVYFITQIFRDDKITIFGDKAFHLDYPNFFDKEAGRNGDGIYIHGTNKELQPNSTNGCVTLANNDLNDLEKFINQVVTPVVIVPELASINQINISKLTQNDFSMAKSFLLTEEIKPENVEYNYLYIVNFGRQTVAVSDFLYRPFNRSIMRGASRAYLKYSPSQGWTASQRIWRVSPLQIYPEAPFKIAAQPLATGEVQLAEQTPEEAAALVAALTSQNIPGTVPAASASSARQREDAAVSSLVAAKPQIEKKPAPPAKKVQQFAAQPPATPAPLAEAKVKIEQPQKIMVAVSPAPPKNKQQIIDFVESWRQAWISKQIEPYIAFYDSSFTSGNKNLAAWRDHKDKLNSTYSFISVDISNISVRWTEEGAVVSFRQEYRSDLYSTKGNKTLYLVHDDRGWKIKQEVYSRI